MSGGGEVRLLFAGARRLPQKRRSDVVRALSDACGRFQGGQPVRLVHRQRPGGDAMAAEIWETWSRQWPALYLPAEPHPSTPAAEVVASGADVCLVFAQTWQGESGDLARAARYAGIVTVDFGVPTGRPERAKAVA